MSATKGTSLPCPRCGEENANVSVCLADVSQFTCQECNEEFTADELRDIITRWGKMLAWLETIPS